MYLFKYNTNTRKYYFMIHAYNCIIEYNICPTIHEVKVRAPMR